MSGTDIHVLDANGNSVPVKVGGQALPISAPGVPTAFTKTITFDGSAGNGALGIVTIATLAGALNPSILIWDFCPLVLASLVSAGGSVALGVTGVSAGFIGPTPTSALTGPGVLWQTTTPALRVQPVQGNMKEVNVAANIILTITTAAITAGSLRLDFYWQAMFASTTVA